MGSLVDYKEDIKSLETEIIELEEQYQEKLKTLESVSSKKVKRKKKAVLQQQQQQARTEEDDEIEITPPRKHTHTHTPYDDIVIPPPAEHEFFDVSIMEFFDDSHGQVRKGPNLGSEPDSDSESESESEIQEKERQILKHINLENLYRMNGITAFAINSNNTNTAKTIDELQELGIRFDILSTDGKHFEKSHYIILKRNEKNKQDWEIFKKTIPKYIELELKWLNIDLYKFVSDIRSQLIKSYQVDQLQNGGASV